MTDQRSSKEWATRARFEKIKAEMPEGIPGYSEFRFDWMHDALRELIDYCDALHAVEPPAVDVAPIAKLTVRDGLVQRAGLYAPGLPDGDHDVFPVPLSPKGELRPHVLAEPPTAWQPIKTAPKDGRQIVAIGLGQPFFARWGDGANCWIDVTGHGRSPSYWTPAPEGPNVAGASSTKEESR